MTSARRGCAKSGSHQRDLLDFVNEWIGVAGRLGELEAARARIVPPATSSAAETNAARLGWVRVANAFVGNAELVGLDPEADRLIFGALREAERAADARAGRPTTPPAGPGPAPAAT